MSTSIAADFTENKPEGEHDDGLPFSRHFLDPVHDFICIKDDVVAAFIDTPQFQRLRYLKQLGTSYFVFPGASHNRFEHCLGVAHLALEMIEGLRERQPELGITDRDVQCVQLAGLCHDLGHGPFSHVFDDQFIPKALPKEKWSHEMASVMMLDALVKDSGIEIDKDRIRFIKDLITGEAVLSRDHKLPEKKFLFDIVANKTNGIDVDKFDYIARDCHNCGMKSNLVASRLIRSARVIGDNIAYNIKDVQEVQELFHTRYSLHKRLYHHKVARGIELMVVDALIHADPILKIAERIHKPEKYVQLTDSIIEEIEHSTNAKLAHSREIIRRIRRRDLYKMVDFRVLPAEVGNAWKSIITSEAIASTAEELREPPEERILLEDVLVDWALLHHGMKDKNPADKVLFYGKHSPNKACTAGPDEGSFAIPERFEEMNLRVYTTNSAKHGLVQRAYRHLTANMAPGVTPTPRTVSREPSADHIPRTPTASFSSLPPLESSPPRTIQADRQNPFTTVPPNYGSTSPFGRDYSLRKRGASSRSPSPSARKRKMAKSS